MAIAVQLPAMWVDVLHVYPHANDHVSIVVAPGNVARSAIRAFDLATVRVLMEAHAAPCAVCRAISFPVINHALSCYVVATYVQVYVGRSAWKIALNVSMASCPLRP